MEKPDGPGKTCWRKEVDVNLKRLHSLLFGAEAAAERGDFSTAHILGLRLLGFLESRTRKDIDEAFIRPIRREAMSNVDAARQNLVAESDRRAFQQANRTPECVFHMNGDIDMEKITQSKYFCALYQQAKRDATSETNDPPPRKGKSEYDTSRVISQANLASLYGNNLSRRSNYPSKSSIASKRSKCMHMEIKSPSYDDENLPSKMEEANAEAPASGFMTAKTKLVMDTRQKRSFAGSPNASVSPQSDSGIWGYGSHGSSRRGVRGNFVPPIRSNSTNSGNVTSRIAGKSDDGLDDSTKRCLEMLCGPDGELPEKLRNLEPRLIEHVSNEIMDRDPNVHWDDIAGLEHAKKCVTEMVIWPLLRPDIFKGCRAPGRGLLLFGPPGTGKTMIGKAIAGEAKATFFYISASSLTSKWIGEGEKLVRALFGVASCRQPAVIFVDEIDSLLSQRKSEGEHESSRRLKTQFLIEMEGFDSGSEQILLIGATNRPQELDEAARRRLTKRLYIPLPSSEARAWIVRNLLEKDGLFKLSEDDINAICKLTLGYSGSDMKNLVKDASMGPLREALRQGIEITKLKKEDMRAVMLQDFETAMQEVRPSVSSNELGIYEEWNKQFGSLAV
ncbi:ATPase family AAA domain-containing protein FIGL1 isoform X2 [Punica granatum]|uniref:ATPase family AAA domain-containing protein FIGL1 isoform X2 n=1 Tax=Punica granatum TaxID=22663 RepID=A0A6P8E0T0_PUNGR|nr:ATPase family AAA domain-containing protein FIGL1 isoform X2 [Punica granatum]